MKFGDNVQNRSTKLLFNSAEIYLTSFDGSVFNILALAWKSSGVAQKAAHDADFIVLVNRRGVSIRLSPLIASCTVSSTKDEWHTGAAKPELQG